MELNDTGKVRIVLTIQGKTFYLNTNFTATFWEDKRPETKMRIVNEAILAASTCVVQMPSKETDILKHRIQELEQEVARLKKQATPTFRYPPGPIIGRLPD
ncbi:hypothetical protein ACQ34_gp01 [Pseudomonas phage YH6]|uniref:Uncharacterized protein n=1 Tax=Pseudomonas phage YH6 TaxID=1566995 RepID=A0A0A0YSF5_9CAUD|nr:hypothetical protein ACQ34_gp01 [Pseudomonas phage YH6]AIX13154.1 hypothetical protein YH6_001 [Pseudomonas phage YH6]AWY02706.1 hypothetical protein [Pseudomonas phage LP14]